ncbi:MAG: hypothetical protein ACXVRD_02810 [Gaiellaceae bacterium]
MKTLFALAATALALGLAAQASSAPAAASLKVRGGFGNLVVPGDRLVARYTVYSGSKAVRGTLYVRNDLQKRFSRLPLTRAAGYSVRVPARFIHGRLLTYYASFRDPKSGRKIVLAKHTAWVLAHPVVVRLGTHQFGQTQSSADVVARASADEVGWDISDEFHLGPQTFLTAADGSTWLEDSFNDRLLVWSPGAPGAFARSIPIPYGAGLSDVAFGPNGEVYVTRKLVDPTRLVLDRLDPATGQIVWESQVGLEYGGGPTGDSYPVVGSSSPLRLGPDGTLYDLVWMGRSADEWGWMPVATPAGTPLLPAAQVKGIHWPYQPLQSGLRLVGFEVYMAHDDGAPHEIRYALVNRAGRVVRSWRILSTTDLNFHQTVPDLAGGDPVVVVDFQAPGQWEYEVLRLGPHGVAAKLSLGRSVFGDSILPDLRVGADGKLYQLSTSPTNGVTISRYSLTP